MRAPPTEVKDLRKLKVGWRLRGLYVEDYVEERFKVRCVRVGEAKRKLVPCGGRMREMRPWVAKYFYHRKAQCWKLTGFRQYEPDGKSIWLLRCLDRYREEGESEFCTWNEYRARKYRAAPEAMLQPLTSPKIEEAKRWYQHVPNAFWRL